MLNLKQIKSKGSLTDKAYNSLKASIISLDLKPGQIIIEEDISEKLGISRTPLRAALQRLSFESLVEIIPAKGTCVTKLTTKYLLDIFALKEVVEILAVKLTALNRTENDIEYLRNLVESQLEVSLVKPLDVNKYLIIDRKLHTALGKFSKNALVEEQVIKLNQAYDRYLHFTEFEYRAVTVVREHMMIVDAIEQRDSVKAQELMKDHTRDVRESILLSISNEKYY